MNVGGHIQNSRERVRVRKKIGRPTHTLMSSLIGRLNIAWRTKFKELKNREPRTQMIFCICVLYGAHSFLSEDCWLLQQQAHNTITLDAYHLLADGRSPFTIHAFMNHCLLIGDEIIGMAAVCVVGDVVEPDAPMITYWIVSGSNWRRLHFERLHFVASNSHCLLSS